MKTVSQPIQPNPMHGFLYVTNNYSQELKGVGYADLNKVAQLAQQAGSQVTVFQSTVKG